MSAIDKEPRKPVAPAERSVELPVQCRCRVCQALKFSARELQPSAEDSVAAVRYRIEFEWGG